MAKPGLPSHIWRADTAPVPRLRIPSTPFDRALQRLWPQGAIDRAIVEMLQGRVNRYTVRNWRRGKARAPMWAIELIKERLNAAASELEKEKAPD